MPRPDGVAAQTAAPKAKAELTPALVAALALLSAFGPMSIDMYLPAFPTIRAEFGAGVSEVQLSLTSFMLAFGFGQVFYGPLGDHFGRRPVLIGGILLYLITSLLCIRVNGPLELIALRFLQGLSASGPPIMARTMVRDLADRDRAAQVMSVLMASVSMAPMLAPMIGSTVMGQFGWRGIFITLTLFGVVALLVAVRFLHETLSPEHRGPLNFAGILRRFAELLASRSFVGYALTTGCLFGAMFSFISVSSFVLIESYGLSPTAYALAFGSTLLAMTVGATVNSRLTRRHGAEAMLRVITFLPAVTGVLLIGCGLIEVTTGALGWIPFIVLAAGLVCSMSFIAPNATACALQRYPHMAGTASSLLGVIQFGCGACFGTAAGALLGHNIFPMTAFMGAGGILSCAAYWFLVRERKQPYTNGGKD